MIFKRLMSTLMVVVLCVICLPEVTYAEECSYEVDWASNGKIEHDSTNGSITFDARDFSRIAESVTKGKLSLIEVTGLSVTEGSVPTFSTIADDIEQKVQILANSMQVSDKEFSAVIEYAGQRDLSDKGSIVKEIQNETVNIPEGYYKSIIVTAGTPQGTATPNTILAGKTAWVNGSLITGEIPVKSNITEVVAIGNTLKMPIAYYGENVKVGVKGLPENTKATAIETEIREGKTAWVNGNKIIGTMPTRDATDKSIRIGENLELEQGYYPEEFNITALNEYGVVLQNVPGHSDDDDDLKKSYNDYIGLINTLEDKDVAKDVEVTMHNHVEGCYKRYHTHDFNGVSCKKTYTDTPHVHSGNTTSGGSCYSAVYHVHTTKPTVGSVGGVTTQVTTGSASESLSSIDTITTSCWSPVFHEHTSACDHVHSGSESSGGGCYTKKNYETCGNITNRTTSPVNEDYDDGICNNCGKRMCCRKDNSDYNQDGHGVHYTSKVVSYNLGCGKTTSTKDCGKTPTTVEDYKLSCGKTKDTVESYTFTCTKTVDTTTNYHCNSQPLNNYSYTCGYRYDTCAEEVSFTFFQD